MQINKEWHDAHKMPKNATLEQRLDWHLNHALNCTCREMPGELPARARSPRADRTNAPKTALESLTCIKTRGGVIRRTWTTPSGGACR